MCMTFVTCQMNPRLRRAVWITTPRHHRPWSFLMRSRMDSTSSSSATTATTRGAMNPSSEAAVNARLPL